MAPTKERLLRDVLDLAEDDAARTRLVIEPAVDEDRQANGSNPAHYHGAMAHTGKTDASVVERRREAAEQLRGMFAHVAPGTSLADELIADRRAEVRAEERAEAERRSAGG